MILTIRIRYVGKSMLYTLELHHCVHTKLLLPVFNNEKAGFNWEFDVFEPNVKYQPF